MRVLYLLLMAHHLLPFPLPTQPSPPTGMVAHAEGICELCIRCSWPTIFFPPLSPPNRVPRPAWLRMQSHALSSQSSLRAPQCRMALRGSTLARCGAPPPPSDTWSGTEQVSATVQQSTC